MKIAILVPTRERMNNRLTLLFSILTTVNDINNVNIYYGVDKDDPTLDIIKKVAVAIPSLKIIEIDNGGNFLGLGILWNKLVKASNEEIISMIGDDMVFKTPGWDTMLLEEFNNMPEDQAIETALVILGAHHEVAAPAISRAWQLLSENSDVELKLSSELSNVLGGRPATQNDLPKLKYTSMVMCEVRRLYPCVWMVMRWSREERQINNYSIPKDSVVLMSQWVSHHDSRYFPDPLSFIPERWSDDSIQGLTGVPYFPSVRELEVALVSSLLSFRIP